MSFSRVLGTPRCLSEDEFTTSVVVSSIDKTKAASTLKYFTSSIPLQSYQLEHLKRIRTTDGVLEIVVCPTSYFRSISAEARALLGTCRDILVSRFPPQTREEFAAWGSYWPINYRPRKAEQEMNVAVDAAQCDIFMGYYDRLLQEEQEMVKLIGKDNMGAILVNPTNNKVVACSSGGYHNLVTEFGDEESVAKYPLCTASMFCIEQISHILQKSAADINNGLLMDQYLCTGLDLYVLQEPDLMSSMALVHSRVRRVIYWMADTASGALGSCLELHLIASLNHHFEVFRKD